MKSYNPVWLPLVWILVTLSLPSSQANWGNENKIKSAVFLSPKFVLGPGSVANRVYYNVDFPKGHIALKSLTAEVIDEAGNPVPLYETYLHHWLVTKYYARKGVEILEFNDNKELNRSDYISGRNSGICQDGVLDQFFGFGSETRKTASHIPDPYGIEFGNPDEIPSGFEEKWLLNVHAIDTRGVEDKMGCTECRCDLYNVTLDESGRPLRPGYNGGFLCCHDGTQCRVKEGFDGIRRTLYLRYTVKWVDMDSSIVPVRIYVFDVADTWKRSSNSTGINAEHDCKYGRLLCSSIPIYGEGEEAGNEAGYVVGMSTCYPQPGTVKISEGETLILESNYSRIRHRTGVMGLFAILVADQLPKPMPTLDIVVQTQDSFILLTLIWAAVALMGVATVIAIDFNMRE